MFEKHFGHSNPSYMYNALNKTENSEENKAYVNIIENKLANLIEALKSSPANDAKKLKTEITCLELFNVFFTLIM